MLIRLSAAILFFISVASCNKARECRCYHNVSYGTDTLPDVFHINGTKKDAEKACKNMADSNEVCSLKK